MKNEPAILSAVAAVVVAVAASKGLSLSTDQVLGVFSTLTALAGILTRAHSVPKAKVDPTPAGVPGATVNGNPVV